MEPRGGMIGNTCQHVGEPGAWVNIVKFGRGDERIHGCCALTAAITSYEEPALSAESHAAQRTLSRVVRQANASITEKARHRLPAFEHIVHRLRPVGVPRQLPSFGSHPLLERCNERCNA